MTLDIVARRAGLGFLPVQDEHYDFVVPKSRANRPGVMAFKTLLQEPRRPRGARAPRNEGLVG